MNTLSWNCQGLGNLRTVLDLCQMVKTKKPCFVFLIETLCSKNRMEWLQVKLGFAGCFVVDLVGRSGGLTLLWWDVGALEIYNFSLRHINATVMDGNGLPLWKLTGFYGHPGLWATCIVVGVNSSSKGFLSSSLDVCWRF
jgi:hypothetical protein